MSDNRVWSRRDFDTDSLVLKRGEETVTLPWWAYEHIRDDHVKALMHLAGKYEASYNLLDRACFLLLQCNMPSVEVDELVSNLIAEAEKLGIDTTK
jgi:hypothetical protein